MSGGKSQGHTDFFRPAFCRFDRSLERHLIADGRRVSPNLLDGGRDEADHGLGLRHGQLDIDGERFRHSPCPPIDHICLQRHGPPGYYWRSFPTCPTPPPRGSSIIKKLRTEALGDGYKDGRPCHGCLGGGGDMSEDRWIEELAVKAVEIEKRYAHDLVNAQTERRRRIRDAIDQIAGEVVSASQEADLANS